MNKDKLDQLCEIILKSKLFDKEYYLSTNPDLFESFDLLSHYLCYGEQQGRRPCPHFDPLYYLAVNNDVKSAGMSPLFHYIKYGEKEGRKPCAYFDPHYYLSTHVDVKSSGLSPLYHYLHHGAEEKRSSCAYLDKDIQITEVGLISDESCIYEKKRPLSISAEEMRTKLIAFYLPQFHPFKENEEWWGEGFTEWTNVTKAKAQYVGHYQPRLPDAMGFYDLRLPETMAKQAEMAKEFGIHGFCFYHYYFNGKRLMEKPVDNFLATTDINFPFMLCWANENWTRRWDGAENDVLIAQKHSPEDDIKFLEDITKYFKDPRYIRVDGKPFLIVYKVAQMPEPEVTLERWRSYWREKHNEELYIAMAQTFGYSDPRQYGFDAAVEFPPNNKDLLNVSDSKIKDLNFEGRIFSYKSLVESSMGQQDFPYDLYKTAFPSWDNTARRGEKAHIFTDGEPADFQRWLEGNIDYSRKNRLSYSFVNAWNEWAEGAHLEPCVKYGYAFLNAAARSIEEKFLRTIEFPQSGVQPEVSIVISASNEFFYTYNCLKSILKNTSREIDFEIIFVDDYSTDETLKIDEYAKNISIIRNNQNLGFILNCNKAVSAAKGDKIVILSNKSEVKKGWLISLIDMLESDADIGLVGSKLLHPDTSLLEAGGIIFDNAERCSFGKLNRPESPEYNYAKETDCVSGVSLILKKELWNSTGGFDEQYSPGFYEDADLAFKVRKRNLKVMYQPASEVVYFSKAFDTVPSEDTSTICEKERQKFVDKWADELREQPQLDTSFFLSRDRSKDKSHILVIDYTVPEYDTHAGSRASFQYTEIMTKTGHMVHFLPGDFIYKEKYSRELEKLGVEILASPSFEYEFSNWFKEHGKYFDYIYLQKPEPSSKFIEVIQKNSKAKIIYFPHDLHHVRLKRQYEISKQEYLLEDIERYKNMEMNLFEVSDVIHVVGEFEKEYLGKSFPETPIHNIPLFIYENLENPLKEEMTGTSGLLFVGGFAHSPNVDAVKWFVEKVFPLLKAELADIKLTVVGSNPTEEIRALASDSIIITGYVTDEELDKYYSESRLVVAPLRYGAGVKGKIVEAMYACAPIVTTSIGAEGLTDAEEFMTIEDEPELMAQKIIKQYNDLPLLNSKIQSGFNYLKKHFSSERALEILSRDIEFNYPTENSSSKL